MNKILICDNNSRSNERLKELLELCKENFDITIFTSWKQLKKNYKNFDIYFLDLDLEESNDGLELTKQIKEDNPEAEIVIINIDDFYMRFAQYAGCAGYLVKPISSTHLKNIMNRIMRSIKSKSCILKTKEGNLKVNLNNLLYINIEERNTCFHLKDKKILGLSLRGSFKNAQLYLLDKPELLFVKPSLIVNIDNIECLSREKIIFSNQEIYYLPRGAYKSIEPVWNYYHEGRRKQQEEVF